jgi:hypothetical protein
MQDLLLDVWGCHHWTTLAYGVAISATRRVGTAGVKRYFTISCTVGINEPISKSHLTNQSLTLAKLVSFGDSIDLGS